MKGSAAVRTATADAPASPPQYGDKDKVLGLFHRCLHDAKQNSARHDRDKQDLQNLFMKRGGPDHQWTIWDNSRGTYVPRPYEGDGALPQWFPRPVSNIFSNKIDGIAALLNQSQPALEVKPSRPDDKDRAAAGVAQHALPVLFDEIDYAAIKPQINKLITLTDKVAVVVYFDTDPKHGMQSIPAYQCQDCGAYVEPKDLPDVPEGEPDPGCPQCGGALAIATHPLTGATIGVDYPVGKICADHYLPFETSLPRSARAADETKVPWILTHSRFSREDAVAKWPELRERLQDGEGSKASGAARDAYADQVRNLSSPRSQTQTSAGAGGGVGPLIYRLWHDPIDDGEYCFPEGLYAVAYEEDTLLETDDGADTGTPAYGKPLPLKDDEGRAVKNVILRTYAHSPGSPWGKPPADDLVQLQILDNLALALAFLTLMHHAAPRTWIPATVTLLDDLVNQPGATIGYRSLNGEKPFTEPGQGFPEALKWFLEYLDKSFDALSNLNAVLQGERPEGDPTLGEIQILQERGLAAFREALDALIAFEIRLAKMLLWTAKQSGWAPRFHRVEGDNGDWDVQQFTGADLDGSIDITCEPASAWPMSVALQNARLMKAFELGILNPQDPEVAQAFLSLNDLLQFKESFDVDRKQIARELDRWKGAQAPAQIGPPQSWWGTSLALHFFLKTQFLKTEEAEAIAASNPPVFQAMVAHVEAIKQLLAPPPAAPAGAGDKTPTGQTLSHAVASGALHPAPTRPRGKALGHAVQAGALKPAAPPSPDQAGGARTQRAALASIPSAPAPAAPMGAA